MNTHANWRTGARDWVQACVVVLLINVLVFPPWLLAQNQVSLSWNGGTGNWTDSNWGCSIDCTGAGSFPNNGDGISTANTYLANIGTGNDSVTLDVSQPQIVIDGLTVGNGTGTSQLNLTNSLTLGTPNLNPGSTVVTINGGGTLNVQSGGTLTLELSSSGATGSNAGSIAVTDGGTLTVQNTTINGGQSTFTNSGNISVIGTSSAATLALNDGGAGNSFLLTGGGTLTMGGIAQIQGQSADETLINDVGHTITGSGTIANLLGFTNNGMLTESGGLAISGITGTYNGSQAVNSGFNNSGTIVVNNSLTVDTSSGGSFYNQPGGIINANDGSTLTLRNISPTGIGSMPNTAVFQNDGAINIGSNPSVSGATLVLDSTNGTVGATGTGTVFDLQSPGGTGTLNLYGNSAIQGQTGTEGLINDYYHTIVATSGSTATIANLASITNNWTIQVGDSNGSASLTLDTSAAGKKAGAFSNTYYGEINVLDGGTLTLQNTTNSFAKFNNDGVITIGTDSPSSAGAALQLNSGGNSTKFLLSSDNGSGLLALLGTSTISGMSGSESLINGVGHTISVGVDENFNLIPSNATISGLAKFTNNGTIYVGGTPTVAPTLTIDTTNPSGSSPGSFSNGYNGSIFVADGSSLAFTNTSTGLPTPNGVPTAVFNNDGIITLGQFSGATLYLNDGNNGTTFDLTSKESTGYLVMNGASAISGVNGTESLINDLNHTITVGVDPYGFPTITSNATISGLAGFTNNGTIVVGVSELFAAQQPVTSSQGAITTHSWAAPSTLTIDTTNPLGSSPGSFSNGYNGSILVADGNSLAFQNTSATLPTPNGVATAVFNNDGVIVLGEFSGAALYLNSGGNNTTFDLTSNKGTGFLVLEGASTISGATGYESLINDTGHTIGADTYANALISNLASFTNNGSVLVGDPSVPGSYASLTFDTTGGGSFYNSGTGSIGVTDDSTLTFRHESANPSNPDTAIFQNSGQIVLGSGLPGGDGATLQLDSSDINGNGTSTTFKLQGSGSLTMYGSEGDIAGLTGTESLINDTGHTIVAGNGSGVLISNLASFVNNGTIQVGDRTGAGSLSIDTGTGSANAAVFSNSQNANITAGTGSTLVFQNTLNASATFNNDGTITLNSASLQLNGGAIPFYLTSNNGTGQLILNGTSSISSLYSGTESLTNGAGHTITNNGAGTISNLASFTNNGTVNVAAGTLSISTTDPQFTNSGTVNVGTAVIPDTQNVAHTAFSTSPGVVMNVDGSFTNSGSVAVYAGATLNVDGVSDGEGGFTGNYTQTSGTTTIDAGGLLSIDTTDFTFFLQGGELTGGGELDANLDETGGTLNPGDPQSFTIDGNYTLDQGAALDLDLAGLGTGQYDQVMVGGSVSIAPNAELQITLDAGFTPQAGQVFTDVLSWQTGGLPSLLSYNDQALGLNFSLIQDLNNSNELDLLVSSATPEPGTLSMLFGAMLIGCAITWKVRRRRPSAN